MQGDSQADRERAVGARDAESSEGLTRHEEQLLVDTRVHEVGSVRARKRVETESVDDLVTRGTEYADVERTEPSAGDSGKIETLPDGSVSIPLLEEELVVTKRLVVRERIIIRKRTVTEEKRIRADLRKERVEIDTVGDAELE